MFFIVGVDIYLVLCYTRLFIAGRWGEMGYSYLIWNFEEYTLLLCRRTFDFFDTYDYYIISRGICCRWCYVGNTNVNVQKRDGGGSFHPLERDDGCIISRCTKSFLSGP